MHVGHVILSASFAALKTASIQSVSEVSDQMFQSQVCVQTGVELVPRPLGQLVGLPPQQTAVERDQ